MLTYASEYFSLAEEARNTEESRHSWNADLRLRHTQVNFVSAGASGNATPPDEPATEQVSKLSVAEAGTVTGVSELSLAYMSIQNQLTTPQAPFKSKAPGATDTPLELDRILERNGTRMAPSEESNSIFMVDTSGFGQRVETGLLPPTVRRSPSPTLSDSSEEIVLFRGRGISGQNRGDTSLRPLSVNQDQKRSIGNPTSPGTSIIHGRSSSADIRGSNANLKNQASNLPVQANDSESAQLVNEMAQKLGKSTRRGPRHSWRHRRQAGKQSEDDGGVADYIENLQANQEEYHVPANAHFTRNLTDLDSGIWQDEPDESTLDEEPDILPSVGWSDDDLQDLNDISTSSEILEAVESVLSRRERPSGRQYLVVWKGYITDDARWVPHSSLSHHTAWELIRAFDSREELARRFHVSGDEENSDSDSDDQFVRDRKGELDELKDEKGLLGRRKARMTDEQIARLLSKQELGLGSAETMLFDGDKTEDPSSEENPEELGEHAAQFNSNRVPRKRGRRKHGSPFVSASAFADVLDDDPYSGFDMMDLDRPSLRRLPKGRHGGLPVELSDPELEASVLLAWEKDRMKKKTQKQQREELRVQGLLGKKGKVDMKAKYAEGMPIAALKAELKDFLESDRERYCSLSYFLQESASNQSTQHIFSSDGQEGSCNYTQLFQCIWAQIQVLGCRHESLS